MPDPDRSDPEVIDFSPRPARTRLLVAIAAAAVIGVAAAVVFVVIKPGAPAAGHANPLQKNSYTRLQRLTPAQQAIFTRYDKLQAVPFADFGNRSALTGSSFSPGVLEHETWSQIAAALENPHGVRGWSILGTANYITAAICQLTGDQPAIACTQAVRSLLPGD